MLGVGSARQREGGGLGRNKEKYKCGVLFKTEVSGGASYSDGKSAGVVVKQEEQVAFFENLVWLNSKEAARYLRRSVGQLRNMVYRRQLEAKTYCRRLYFRRTDLDRVIERSLKGRQ